MKYLLSTTLFLSIGGAALADVTPREWKRPELSAHLALATLERCSPGKPEFVAQLIVDWSLRCKHIKDNSLTEKIFYYMIDEETGDWEPMPEGSLKYPIFAYNKPNELYPKWFPDMATCSMPRDMLWLGVCQSQD